MLFDQSYPHAYVDSVFSIDYQKLYDKGYRGILFDIDNTLVHHGKDSTQEVDALFRELHRTGFQTLLLSNNSKERIERFMRNIDSLYIDEADKPNPAAYGKALEMLGLSKEQVVCIGDQLFTDILGANRSGLDSILVRYLRYPGETKIGIRRNLEKVVLRFYLWSPSYRNRLGDIQKKESADHAGT